MLDAANTVGFIRASVSAGGSGASAFDIAPTILHIYGIEPPPQMQGHVLTEIF